MTTAFATPPQQPLPPIPRRISSKTLPRRSASAGPTSHSPHPALRVSSRTHAAITYALEEALRKPNPFTPNLEEELAQMSDLGGARAQNGSARTGPVPSGGAGSTGAAAGLRTPRQIMNERNAREARRQEEQKVEEQRRLADERRRSADRRAAAVGGGAPRISQSSSAYTPETAQQPFSYDAARGRTVPGSDALGEPTGRASQDYAGTRARGSSATQPDRPRAAQRTPMQSNATAPSTPATQSQAQAGASSQPSGGASAFPHAFERWETLSSHWEGLTSYWLHKLEQNHEEIRATVPNAVTLNRQITDLSAAGANLFHAVVELQRLRASSERKFQRWFFETRGENERNREIQAQLENQVRVAQAAHETASRARSDVTVQAENTRREMAEIRRELVISKDEARRAWEELGRRNQEALETAERLKRGMATFIHGIEVRPHYSAHIASASASRAGTGDAQRYYAPPTGGAAGGEDSARILNPGGEPDYYRQETSPTITDPFMDTEPLRTTLPPGTYDTQTTGAVSTPTAARTGNTGGASNSRDPQRFYQQPPQDTYLHSPPSSGPQPGPPTTAAARDGGPSEGSYIDTVSEGDTEYAVDAAGNIRRDATGRPLPYRQQHQQQPGLTRVRGQSGASDDYDTAADVRREQELAARYGHRTGGGGGGDDSAPPEAPSAPPTSAAAMAGYDPATSNATATAAAAASHHQQDEEPNYEGEGYDEWEPLQASRHRHPTRLSDVLEEEEERSSRRTGD